MKLIKIKILWALLWACHGEKTSSDQSQPVFHQSSNFQDCEGPKTGLWSLVFCGPGNLWS